MTDAIFFILFYGNMNQQFLSCPLGFTKRFTKIIKHNYAILRFNGFIGSAYINDRCMHGSTFADYNLDKFTTCNMVFLLESTTN